MDIHEYSWPPRISLCINLVIFNMVRKFRELDLYSVLESTGLPNELYWKRLCSG